VDPSVLGTVPVTLGLCGSANRTKRILSWHPSWNFEKTITDMVHAELESRPPQLRSEP
jgi:GDP-D-mannose dehydratase